MIKGPIVLAKSPELLYLSAKFELYQLFPNRPKAASNNCEINVLELRYSPKKRLHYADTANIHN